MSLRLLKEFAHGRIAKLCSAQAVLVSSNEDLALLAGCDMSIVGNEQKTLCAGILFETGKVLTGRCFFPLFHLDLCERQASIELATAAA